MSYLLSPTSYASPSFFSPLLVLKFAQIFYLASALASASLLRFSFLSTSVPLYNAQHTNTRSRISTGSSCRHSTALLPSFHSFFSLSIPRFLVAGSLTRLRSPRLDSTAVSRVTLRARRALAKKEERGKRVRFYADSQ